MEIHKLTLDLAIKDKELKDITNRFISTTTISPQQLQTITPKPFQCPNWTQTIITGNSSAGDLADKCSICEKRKRIILSDKGTITKTHNNYTPSSWSVNTYNNIIVTSPPLSHQRNMQNISTQTLPSSSKAKGGGGFSLLECCHRPIHADVFLYTIAPCGHCICSNCFEHEKKIDCQLKGIQCHQCNNALPITKVYKTITALYKGQ